MHAQLGFVDPATAIAVLNIPDHVGFCLELRHFFRSERERQPSLNVSLFPDTAVAIADKYDIAPDLSLYENTTVIKNLTIEPILPCPKCRVPRFNGLPAF